MRFVISILAVVGAFLVAFIIAIVGFGFFAAQKGAALAKSAAAYSDETISAYGESWDPATLMERASPEFLAAVAQNPDSLNQLNATLTVQAGKLVSASPSTCSSFNFVASAGAGETFTAQCQAQGIVEKGAAQFTVSVVHRNDAWRLLGVFVLVTPSQMQDEGRLKVVNFISQKTSPANTLEAAFGVRTIALSATEKSISFGTGAPFPAHVGAGVEIADAEVAG